MFLIHSHTYCTQSILHYSSVWETKLNISKFVNAAQASLNNGATNRQTISINKFHHMTITNMSDFPPVLTLLSNQELEPTEEVEFSGLLIDDEIEFLHHSVYNASKVSHCIGVMKDILPQFVFQQLYNSLVLPYPNHCIFVWGASPKHTWIDFGKLEKDPLEWFVVSHTYTTLLPFCILSKF